MKDSGGGSGNRELNSLIAREKQVQPTSPEANVLPNHTKLSPEQLAPAPNAETAAKASIELDSVRDTIDGLVDEEEESRVRPPSERPEDADARAQKTETEAYDHETWAYLSTAEASSALLEEFVSSRKQYASRRGEMFGADPVHAETIIDKVKDKIPLKVKKAWKGTKNITRWIEDLVARLGNRSSDAEVQKLSLKLDVLGRTDLLDDPAFQSLAQVDGNREILLKLLDQEVFKEANLSHFVMVSGASVAQFHHLMRELGHKPTAFLSDDRGENGGRIVMDNMLEEGEKHPLLSETDPRYQDEMKYWDKVFPGSPEWAFWSNYRMSRLHGTVYAVKDAQGNDVLLSPIHIDPKNAIVAVAEVLRLRKKQKDEHHGLAYHDAMLDEETDYLGTGLYDLGCSVFIRQLERAQATGKFAELTVSGADRIRTSGTIIEDDARTWEIRRQVAEKSSTTKE